MSILNKAQDVFRSDAEGTLALIPRQRFNFTLSIEQADRTETYLRVISTGIPSFSYDTMIANQYNKKRVIQSKINYDPVTVTFIDTFDNQFVEFIERYNKNYYNNGQGITTFTDVGSTSEAIDPQFTTNMGFTATTAAGRYMIKNVFIVQEGQDKRTWSLKNPIITSIQSDTLSYSDSTPTQFTVTFQPESSSVSSS